MTAPFLLRRRKTDPAVLPDLPPRQDSNEFCTLTVEQAALYQATIDAMLARVRELSGIERRGHVLALITRLKQVCNHPVHALGRHGTLTGRSGKLDRLTEMLAEVVAEGDSALVFTQYAVMGRLLAEHLERELGSRPAAPGRIDPACRRGSGSWTASRRRAGAARAGDVAARRRPGAEPDEREPRLPLRPLVEPGGRGSGLRPRAPHRPDAGRAGAPDGVRRHDRGADRRADRRQARPGDADRRPRRRVARSELSDDELADLVEFRQ